MQASKKAFETDYFALICSDGLTDTVNPKRVNGILCDHTENLSLQQKVEQLYDLTMSRAIEDNVSIIAVNLGEYLEQLFPIQTLKLSFD